MRSHAKATVALSALLLTLAFGASQASAEIIVKLAGSGEGTVTSEPAGIECSNVGGGTPGPDCAASFPIFNESGEANWLDLTATAGPGDYFVGWSGTDVWAEGNGGPSCIAGNTSPCETLDGAEFEYPNGEITATFAPAVPPVVTIDPVSSIEGHSAHFSGTVNPEGQPTTCRFDYLPKSKLDQNVSEGNGPFLGAPQVPCEADPGNGTEPVSVAAEATGLEPSTVYEVRLLASGQGEASAVASFETDPVPPIVLAGTNTPTEPGGAEIRAYVNTRNSTPTDCHFEYGATTSYGSSIPCPGNPTSAKATEVSAEVSGLTPGATYHYKLVVTTPGGTSETDDALFRTAAQEVESCANDSALGAALLPGCRAWEMVSPPDKNGGEIVGDTTRTRAAADGSAVGYISLTPFADAVGINVAADYIAKRSTDPDPGDNGWATHAITPKGKGNSYATVANFLEPLYEGEFSPDLDRGIYFTRTPQAADPAVANVPNLYLRTDLRSPGPGSYELLTACPLCAEPGGAPLPFVGEGENPSRTRPLPVGASADLGNVAFESGHRLTADPGWVKGLPRLYESDHGIVRLVGRAPVSPQIECDDQSASTCEALDLSIGGAGAGANHARYLTPHTVSDGSDGHSRIFFTWPTDDGVTSYVGQSSGASSKFSKFAEGEIYLREDGHRTVQLNASENPDFEGFALSIFLDASADGKRAFFLSDAPLTEDAPPNGAQLYMYDATKPASAPDNLTLVSVDEEPGDPSGVVKRVLGVGGQGRYVYFAADSQLVDGAPLLDVSRRGIYLWHDGKISFVGEFGRKEDVLLEQLSSAVNYELTQRQARVTPDGRHLLFSTNEGANLLGYDHGKCAAGLEPGCREFYVYAADTNTLQCTSCAPAGGTAAIATLVVREGEGGTKRSTYQNRAVSDDGRYVFFSSAEKLVPEDTNGVSDAYLYDTHFARPRLLSSGLDPGPSYFLDASADGADAFVRTAEPLSAWDFDQASDLYDARIAGGFPEPPPPPPSCVGDACQPAPRDLSDPSPGSAAVSGPGDRKSDRNNRRPRCGKGRKRVKARNGKHRCVKKNHKRVNNANRRAGR